MTRTRRLLLRAGLALGRAAASTTPPILTAAANLEHHRRVHRTLRRTRPGR